MVDKNYILLLSTQTAAEREPTVAFCDLCHQWFEKPYLIRMGGLTGIDATVVETKYRMGEV